jgi:ankyrin repeat protein
MGHTTPLHSAAQRGELVEVERVLNTSPADLEAKAQDGYTPLMEASDRGHLAIVQALVQAGAQKEARSIHGTTPLILASDRGHLAVVQALVQAGAEKEASDVNGYTPLIAASARGHLAVVLALVRTAAETDAKDKYGCTPLILASGTGHLAVVQALVRAGADKEAEHENGCTPLIAASAYGHLAVVQALVQAGVAKEAKNVDGDTSLIAASVKGHLAVVQELVRAGAVVTTVANGKTAEQAAREAGHTAVADFLHRHREQLAEKAMASLLLLDDDTGTRKSGQGQAAKKAKAKKNKKAKQKLCESKAQNAAGAGNAAALAAAKQEQGQDEDRERQQRVREELLLERAEVAAQEQEFKRALGLHKQEVEGHLEWQGETRGGSEDQSQQPRQQQQKLAVATAVTAATEDLAQASCRGGVGKSVDLLECPICMESYAAPPSENAPVSLPCGHSVCKQCAADMQAAALRCRKGGGPLRIACPSCRRQLDLPPGGVKSLPFNYALVQAAQAIEDTAWDIERERAAAPAAALAAAAAPLAQASGPNAAAAVGAQASPTSTTVKEPVPSGVSPFTFFASFSVPARTSACTTASWFMPLANSSGVYPGGAAVAAGAAAGAGDRGGGDADGRSAGGDDCTSSGGLDLADLLQQLQFTSAQIADYVPALTEAGYDLVEDLATATAGQLSEEAGMKKPHARRITTHFSQ